MNLRLLALQCIGGAFLVAVVAKALSDAAGPFLAILGGSS